MRIGVFGGSFNPPHLAHLIIAELLREAYHLDRVLWIPGAQPPHKNPEDLAPANLRLEMVLRATAEHTGFQVSTLELERSGPSYTVDTILDLKRRQPDDEYLLMIGGDSLAAFHTWKDPLRIIDEVPLLVYDREGPSTPSMDLPQERIFHTSVPRLDISSTEIRRRCARGASIRYLVPAAVESFIRAHALYQK